MILACMHQIYKFNRAPVTFYLYNKEFLHRPSGQTFAVHPEKGQGLVHTAVLKHEGLAITKGKYVCLCKLPYAVYHYILS